MRIIVGHASRRGSTAEIAERIAETLRRTSDDVDVVAMAKAKSVEGCDGIVLGSAIHNQAWLPEASDFLYRQSGNLAGTPIWLFSVGMSAGLPAPLRGPARRAQEKRIAQAFPGEVRPRSHRVFSGVGSPDLLPRWGQFLFRAAGGRFGDYRDWAGIEAWAQSIARDLHGSESMPQP